MPSVRDAVPSADSATEVVSWLGVPPDDPAGFAVWLECAADLICVAAPGECEYRAQHLARADAIAEALR